MNDLQWVTHPVRLRSSVADVTFFYRRNSTEVDYLLFHRHHKSYLVNTRGMLALYRDVKSFFSEIGEKKLTEWWSSSKPKRSSLKGRFMGHRLKDLCVHTTLRWVTSLPYDVFDFLQNKKYGKNFLCIPAYIPVSTLSRFNSAVYPFSAQMAYVYLTKNPTVMRVLNKKDARTLSLDIFILSHKRGILTGNLQKRS